MTAHDEQTLLALAHAQEGALGSAHDVFDVFIRRAGDRLFGKGWTSVRRGSPQVNMSLGKLRVAGLVRHNGRHVVAGRQRFYGWDLTDSGRAEVRRLLGPLEGPAS